MPLIDTAVAGDDLALRWRFARPAADVWARLVDPATFPLWLGRPVVADVREGGLLEIDHEDGYVCRSPIHELRTGERLAMGWSFPDEHTTAVTVALAGSEMTLTHTGLAHLAASYRAGWIVHLTYFEAAVDGAPLPLGAFWNLHASVVALLAADV